MPEGTNDGILSLNAKKVTNFALSLKNKPHVLVQELIFHYVIKSCANLKRQLI